MLPTAGRARLPQPGVHWPREVTELFDLVKGKAEIDNVVEKAPAALVTDLSADLQALSTCAGDSCRTADTWTDATTAS